MTVEEIEIIVTAKVEEALKEFEKMLPAIKEKMKQILGTKVSINAKDENKGKIEIEYYNKEDLDRLIDMILKQNRRSGRRKYDI